MNEVMFHPEVQLKDEMWMATSAMAEDISMWTGGEPHISHTNGKENDNSRPKNH